MDKYKLIRFTLHESMSISYDFTKFSDTKFCENKYSAIILTNNLIEWMREMADKIGKKYCTSAQEIKKRILEYEIDTISEISLTPRDYEMLLTKFQDYYFNKPLDKGEKKNAK